MKRSWLNNGAKSVARGSTFKTRGAPLARSEIAKRRGISPASMAQREKVAGLRSIVSGEPHCTPTHLWPRGRGGCDDALCVVPTTFHEHRLFDDGRLDLLPHLLAAGCVAEIQHALGHCDGSLIQLLERLTGQRWAPADLSPEPDERNMT